MRTEIPITTVTRRQFHLNSSENHNSADLVVAMSSARRMKPVNSPRLSMTPLLDLAS